MRLLGTAMPVVLGRGTNYATIEARERRGLHPSTNDVLGGVIGSVRRDPGAPLLTAEERWSAYRQVPDIRACIDSIVRVVSTYDWTVSPIVEPQDPLYDRALAACMDAERFLAAPTIDGKSWQTMQSMLTRDLLIHDVYAAELPTTRRGRLEEIAPLPGGQVVPVVDRRGRTVGYVQDVPAASGKVEFGADELVYLNLFPSTSYVGGTPLIETLLLEVGTALHSARHLLSAYSVDEIGAGLLVLAGITGKNAERWVESVKQKRGSDDALRVLYGDNPALDGKWVEFKRSPKDLDMATLVKEVRRTIWRTFGCKPVTMGDSEATPRATAEVQVEAEDSGLIRPTLEMIQGAYNARVMPLVIGDPALAGAIEFRFRWDRDLAPAERKTDAEADALDFDRGILTLNERRAKRGAPALPDGDVPLIKTAGGYTPLADVVRGSAPTPTVEPMDDDEGLEPDEPTDGGNGEADDTPISEEPAPGEVEAGRRLIQRAPEKYAHINFTPPKAVQKECGRGVAWVEDGKGGDGLKPETVRWARRLARGEDITPEKARKMRAWLARHEIDKEAEGFRPGEDGYPSPGRVAWACWGGDPAVGWSGKIVAQMDAADREDKAAASPARMRLRRVQVWDAPLVRAPCECGAVHHARSSELLPSDWQPAGRFKGYRTLPLKALGDAIVDYRTEVWPLYRQARLDVEAAVRAYVPVDDFIDTAKAQRLQQEITVALDKLAEGWSASTDPHYRRAAQIGRDAATEFTGVAVQARYAEIASMYHDRAMGWLNQSDGLIGALRAELSFIVTAITRGTGLNHGLQNRQRQSGRATLDRMAVLGAVAKAFSRNEHRIDNWSGKLVDLSNEVLLGGLTEGGAGGGEDTPPEERGQEWWCEWVAVGDVATCATCARESAAGFRPISQLQTHPGGATECGARDRCVLVWWLKSEIDSGKAVRLSG